jgi:YVTN family beta-propeller protein
LYEENSMKKITLTIPLVFALLISSGGWINPVTILAEGQSPSRAASIDNQYGYTGASITDSLAIFDLTTHIPLPFTIDLLPQGDYPYDATLNTPGDEVWITGATGDGVVVVETISNTVFTTISAVGDYPVDVLFSEGGDLAFVSARDSDYLAVINPLTYSLVDTVPFQAYPNEPGKMALNRCSGEIYVVDWYDDYFSVVDPVSLSVTETFDLGTSLWDLVMDPEATTIYVTDRGTDQVHVVDAASLSLVTSISVGDDPWGIDITPDGTLVFVANEDSHNISVIDTALNVVIDTIDLTSEHDPRDVDIRGDGVYAYFPSGAITGNDMVEVIDISTLQWVDSIDISPASNPNVVAVAPQLPSLDPQSSFTSNSPVPFGTPVEFTDTSTNNPFSWNWDFGDGVGTSTE